MNLTLFFWSLSMSDKGPLHLKDHISGATFLTLYFSYRLCHRWELGAGRQRPSDWPADAIGHCTVTWPGQGLVHLCRLVLQVGAEGCGQCQVRANHRPGLRVTYASRFHPGLASGLCVCHLGCYIYLVWILEMSHEKLSKILGKSCKCFFMYSAIILYSNLTSYIWVNDSWG